VPRRAAEMPGSGVAADPALAADTVTGYALVLPTGWRRIPVRSGTKAAIRGITTEVLRRFPEVSRDKLTPYRIELERRLSDMARQARSAGGLDLYVPVEYVHGTAVPASFVVSQVTLPVGSPGDQGDPDAPPEGEAATAGPAEVIAAVTATNSSARPVVTGGAQAVRTESVAGPDPAQEIPVGSRRADYMIPLPGRADRWLIATFSTTGDGDPEGDFAKLLVELFDAIMLTFRWTADGGAG
jgi:hypothetical protein